MKISDVLNKEAVQPDLKAENKEGIITELAQMLAGISGMSEAELVRVLTDRERLGSTGIGSGIGIPHGKIKGLSAPLMALGLSRNGVDFESLDGKPVYIFFMLLTPEHSTGIHLKLLAGVSKILRNEPFRRQLLMAKTQDEIFAIIRSEEESF